MLRNQASCFLIFLITISLAASKMVNLTAEAERYIDDLNKTWQNITSWGLGSEYYNRAKTNTSAGQSIKATVHNFTCQPAMKNYLLPNILMIGSYFRLEDGIYCPFRISVNIALPVHTSEGFQNANVSVTLNNKKGRLIRSPDIKPPTGKDIRKIRQKCRFSARVLFNGSFAYEAKTDEGNITKYFLVPVGNLNSTSQGLRRNGDYLTYDINGSVAQITYLPESTYKHILV